MTGAGRTRLARLLGVGGHDIELLDRPAPMAPLSLALFALGVLAAAAAAWAVLPSWHAHAELLAERTRLESAIERVAGGAPASAGSARMAHERLDEAHALVGELHRPWHALLDQLETAQGKDVHLISLQVESHFDNLQLVVEARDIDAIVRFAQRVGALDGPIRGMELTHHEWHDALGAHVVLATMQGPLEAGSSAP